MHSTLILLALILVLTVLLYLLSSRNKTVKLLCSPLAVGIAAGLMLTVCIILGLAGKPSESQEFLSRIGLRSFKDSPWFISCTMLFIIVLGMFIMERRKQNPKSALPHLFTGIWILVLSFLMSNLSIQQYIWTGWTGAPKDQATSQSGRNQAKKLPFTIEVSRYRADCHPPVIYIVDSRTGKVLPLEAPASLPIDPEQYAAYAAGKAQAQQKQIQEWNVKVTEYLPHAWIYHSDNQYTAKASLEEGNAPAAKVELKSSASGETRTTWLSCGSALQIPCFLRIDSTRIIGMEDPVPFHQIAYLNLCKSPKGSGSPKTDSLWHGHPSRMDGYDIYLKDVKTAEAGFWNPDVQLELVRDPWKTGMYAGLAYILLALAGMLIQRLFCHREQEDGKES